MPIQVQDQHLKVGYGFIEFVKNNNRAIMAHLYRFVSVTGQEDYFTDLDWDVTAANNLWKGKSLRFEGVQRKLSVGMEVDEQQITIWANPTDTLFGSNFLTGVEQGLLDGAVIVRYRAVWNFVTGNAYQDTRGDPIAYFPLFTGFTGQLSEGGSSHVKVQIRSALARLEVNMPKNYYQPGCLWTLFGSGCTLSKTAHTVTGTVGSNPTQRVIPVSGGIATPTGADGIQEYAQGRLTFTSGVNSGLQVLIDTNDGSNLYLAYPLDQTPSVGDGISYTPGCSKSFATCQSKYANNANFRGFDKVPPVMISM